MSSRKINYYSHLKDNIFKPYLDIILCIMSKIPLEHYFILSDHFILILSPVSESFSHLYKHPSIRPINIINYHMT